MLAGSHRNAWPDETGTGGRTNRNTQPLSSVHLSASWHIYHSDAGSSKLGTEINSSATYDLLKQLNLMFKLSHYQADNYGVDTNKLWLMATYSI